MDDAAALMAHTSVVAIENALQSLSSAEPDIQSRPEVEELHSRLEYLHWVIEQSDPRLISRTELNTLASSGQNLTTHTTIHSLNVKLSSIEVDNYYARFPYPRFKKIPRSESQKIIEQVQAQADVVTQDIKLSADSVKVDLQGAIEEIDSIKESIKSMINATTLIEEKQDNINSEIGIFIEKLTSSLEARIDERLVESRNRFAKIVDDFQESVSENRAQASVLLTEIGADRKAAAEKSDRELQQTLGSLESEGQNHLAKIRTIYGIVGGDASSGQLIQSANGEALAYKVLGTCAFVAFLAGSIFAFRAIQPALVTATDWQTLASRASLVLASYIPAWFLASLAMKHRRAELMFRSLAVRVAAFDPYLAEFAADDRIAIKKQMAEMFFSADIQAEKSRDFRIKDLKDFEKMISPLESIIEKFRSIVTRTE